MRITTREFKETLTYTEFEVGEKIRPHISSYLKHTLPQVCTVKHFKHPWFAHLKPFVEILETDGCYESSEFEEIIENKWQSNEN